MAAAVAAAIAGCAHRGRPGEESLPILAATPAEVTARIDAGAAAFSSLKGTLGVAFDGGAGRDARSCSAVLAARGPRAGDPPGLYLKGWRSLVPTLFTLVSDGRRFWLHVPRDNVVYTGPVSRRGSAEVHGVRLEARDLFRALFLEPVAGAGTVEVAEEPAAYVVSVRRSGRLERRLWVERRRFTVRREAFYDAAGNEELSIDRERWVDLGGRPHPQRLRVRDAATGASVTLEFDRMALDPPDLGADPFRPPAPAGARVVAVAGEEDGA